MRRSKETKNGHHHSHKLSLVSLPEVIRWNESDLCTDMDFIQRFTGHLKLVIPSGGGRSLICQGDNLETRTLTVEDKTKISSRLRSCLDYVIYDESKYEDIQLSLSIVSNLVMWIRDGGKRFLGSVRVDENTGYLAILDCVGRPCVLIDRRDPRTKDSNDSTLHDGSSSHLITYRCAKSSLILATCRIFHSHLKPQSKPAKVVALDFRSKDILHLIDPNGMKRRLCLASVVFLESALKKMKGDNMTKWYL